PLSPATLKPYKIPPKPSVESMMDTTSTFGFLSSVTFLSRKYAAMISRTAIGSTKINTLRQGNWSNRKPQRLGQIDGANAMTKQNRPIAVPHLLIGKDRKRIVCIKGIMMPAPEACSTCPAISTEKLGAMAHMKVPSVNKPIAVKNSLRVVNLSIKKAVTGI